MPTLFQTNAPRISFYDVIADALRCPVTHADDDCMRVALHVLLGNPALRPERSRQVNAGVVWEPMPAASIGVDDWRIDLNEQILFGGRFIFDHETLLPGSVVRGPATDTAMGLPGPIVTFNDTYVNLTQANADGIDVDLRARWETASAGRFTASATVSYQRTYGARFTPDSAVVELSGSDGVPRTRAVAPLLWQRSPWDASLTANFIELVAVFPPSSPALHGSSHSYRVLRFPQNNPVSAERNDLLRRRCLCGCQCRGRCSGCRTCACATGRSHEQREPVNR